MRKVRCEMRLIQPFRRGKIKMLKFTVARARMLFPSSALQDDLQTLLSPGTAPFLWSLICPG
ncbi:hypothetical protein F6R83_10645 [Citrobacter amalonaticus]|nr:hypothetical protein [Citrobacter amalonaticus]